MGRLDLFGCEIRTMHMSDLLGYGAAGIVIDAAADALDHGNRHRGRAAGAGGAERFLARRSIGATVAGAAARCAPG